MSKSTLVTAFSNFSFISSIALVTVPFSMGLLLLESREPSTAISAGAEVSASVKKNGDLNPPTPRSIDIFLSLPSDASDV